MAAVKPKKCCVENCRNGLSKRHRFPKNDKELCNVWIELLKPPNYKTLSVEEIYNKYYVCEEHFDPKCIVPSTNKRGLKRNAVPTVNVPGFHNFDLEGVTGKRARLIDGGYVKDSISRSSAFVETSLASLSGNKCAFVNCGKSKRDDPTLRIYKFPLDKVLAKQWIINSGDLSLLTMPPELLRRKCVCSDHFIDTDYSTNIKRKLTKGVVPKRNIANLSSMAERLGAETNKAFSSEAISEPIDSLKEPLDELEIQMESINDNTVNEPLQSAEERNKEDSISSAFVELEAKTSLALLSGNKCAFVNCGKSKRDDPTLKIYRFPIDKVLAKQWIIKSGNLSLLAKPPELLRRKFVCSDHFNDTDFVNPNIRKVLKKGVVPKRYKANLFPNQYSQPSVSSSSYNLAEQGGSETNKAFSGEDIGDSPEEPSDEQEIKIESINDNTATDPLQLNEKPDDSQSLKPTSPICPIPKAVINKDGVPVTVGTIVIPPGDFIKQQKVQTLKSGNLAMPTPVQQVVTEKSPIQSSTENKNTNKAQKDNLCAVKVCWEKATHYFEVPSDARRSKIWSFCLNLPLKSGELICENHFIAEDILIRPTDSHIGKVKGFAVPSMQKVIVGCCISECINKDKNTPNMYPIPIWGYFHPWLKCMHNLNWRVGLVREWLRYRVCERHFSKQSLQWLLKGVDMTPSINLPSKKYYEDKLQSYLENRGPGLEKLNFEEPKTVKILPKEGPKSKLTDICSYLGCTLNKEDSHFKFYKFPVDYDRAIKWLEACSRVDILFKPRDEIQEYITNSIGVCFLHMNAMEKKLRRNEYTTSKLEYSKNETSKFTIKVCPGKTWVEKNNDKEVLTIPNEIEGNTSSCNANQSTTNKCYVPAREYCAFVNCSTYIKDPVKKYRFPADHELLAQWIEAAGISKKLSGCTLRTLFVCGKHFTEDQYTELGTLILSSVPAPHTEFVDSCCHEGNEHWIMKEKITKVANVPECPEPSKKSSSILGSNQPVISGSPQPAHTSIARYSPSSFRKSKMWGESSQSTSLKRKLKEENCVVKHCKLSSKDIELFPFPEQDSDQMMKWVAAVEGKLATEGLLLQNYTGKQICAKHFEKRYQIGRTLLTHDAVPTLDLVEETPEEEEEDTSIVWKKCNSDIFDTDYPDPKTPHIRGNAILRENSIEFPNMGRELRFGKDCPKMGYMQKFPYKLFRMTKQVIHGREVDSVSNGHKLQIHTAIIVDDDDASEKEAIKVVSRIIMENAKLVPKRLPRKRSSAKKEA